MPKKKIQPEKKSPKKPKAKKTILRAVLEAAKETDPGVHRSDTKQLTTAVKDQPPVPHRTDYDGGLKDPQLVATQEQAPSPEEGTHRQG
jgi:hypothetical protein